jgi:hypothetical protein
VDEVKGSDRKDEQALTDANPQSSLPSFWPLRYNPNRHQKAVDHLVSVFEEKGLQIQCFPRDDDAPIMNLQIGLKP